MLDFAKKINTDHLMSNLSGDFAKGSALCGLRVGHNLWIISKRVEVIHKDSRGQGFKGSSEMLYNIYVLKVL